MDVPLVLPPPFAMLVAPREGAVLSFAAPEAPLPSWLPLQTVPTPLPLPPAAELGWAPLPELALLPEAPLVWERTARPPLALLLIAPPPDDEVIAALLCEAWLWLLLLWLWLLLWEWVAPESRLSGWWWELLAVSVPLLLRFVPSLRFADEIADGALAEGAPPPLREELVAALTEVCSDPLPLPEALGADAEALVVAVADVVALLLHAVGAALGATALPLDEETDEEEDLDGSERAPSSASSPRLTVAPLAWRGEGLALMAVVLAILLLVVVAPSLAIDVPPTVAATTTSSLLLARGRVASDSEGTFTEVGVADILVDGLGGARFALCYRNVLYDCYEVDPLG